MRDSFEWAKNAVLRSTSYIDTVKVYVDRKIDDAEKIWLDERCGSIREIGPLRYHEARWKDGIVLHQPSAEALAYVSDGFDSHLLSRADVSLDLITGTFVDARSLQDYLEPRLLQKWRRGKQPVVKTRGTLYYKRAGGRNNLVVYSDRLSKIEVGRPCVHIEWRMERAAAIKTSGIASTDDLTKIDLKKLLRDRLSLRDLLSDEELQKLGRAIQGAGKSRPRLPMRLPNRLVIDRYPMAATAWLRASRGNSRDIGWAVQDVLDTHGQRWERYFRPLPMDWMFQVQSPPMINSYSSYDAVVTL